MAQDLADEIEALLKRRYPDGFDGPAANEVLHVLADWAGFLLSGAGARTSDAFDRLLKANTQAYRQDAIQRSGGIN